MHWDDKIFKDFYLNDIKYLQIFKAFKLMHYSINFNEIKDNVEQDN